MTELLLHRLHKIERIENKLCLDYNILNFKAQLIFWFSYGLFFLIIIHFTDYFLIKDHAGHLGVSILLNIIASSLISIVLGAIIDTFIKIYILQTIGLKKVLKFLWPYKDLIQIQAEGDGCDPQIKDYLENSSNNMMINHKTKIDYDKFIKSIKSVLEETCKIRDRINNRHNKRKELSNFFDIPFISLFVVVFLASIITVLNPSEKGWSTEESSMVSEKEHIIEFLKENPSQEFKKYVSTAMINGLTKKEYRQIKEKYTNEKIKSLTTN